MADPFFTRSQMQNGASNGYKSPLEKTLADLRRKYVAAAGPLGGFGSQEAVSTDAFLMEYSLLPSGDDIHIDVSVKSSLVEEDYAERRKSVQMARHSSVLFRGRRMSMNMMSARGSSTFATSSEWLGSSGNLSPRSSLRKVQSPSSHGSEKIISGQAQGPNVTKASSFLDQRAAFMECATRYRGGVASNCHAENLIACAPHLRHISPASTDMQGNGSSSRNPIAAFIMQQTRSGEGTAETGKNRVAAMSDYQNCVARKLANRRIALELATFVQILANEMSLEEFTVAEGEIFSEILLFMHSNDNNKRLAGVAALDALIGATSADEEKKITKVAKNLSDSLFKASNVDYEFLSEVTNALGKMALGASNVDYVESVVKRVPEWLKRDRSDRRLAAVLTVKELAENAPAAFYSKTNQSEVGQEGGTSDFMAQIFPVLTDEQPVVRVCAADALAECMRVIVDPSRKHHSTTLILGKVYSFVMQVFKEQNKGRKIQRSVEIAETEAKQHAALLVIGDLLELPLDFMLPRFDEVCVSVLGLKDHAKALIRLEVVRLIPRLARRSPALFRRRYLGQSLEYVMSAAKTPPPPRSGIDLRPTAYFALGQLALAVCDHESGVHYVPKSTIQFNLKEPVDVNNNKRTPAKANYDKPRTVSYQMKAGDIYSNIKEMFTLIREGLGTVRTEALHCGADVIEALGEETVKPYIDGILNNMFHSGLSDDLISCLRSIAGSLPSKAYDIENRLLQELSLSLAGTTAVKEICDPLFALPFDADFDIESDEVFIAHRHRPSPSISINMRENSEDIMKLDLSLRTLRSFGNIQSRKGLSLLPFVRDAVAQYLSHPSQDVRKEAALTCCFLLLPRQNLADSTDSSTLGTSSIILLEEVLQKLLRVAVSDSSPVVRNCIVKAFGENYDSYLCQTHHLPPLFLLMQDEALSVRSAALELLGRLAGVNPGLVLPEMRRILIQLITELKCSDDTGCGKEAATRLLMVFFRSTALHRLVHPFLDSIIAVLPLKGNAPRVTAAALDALGELACVVKDELKPWMHELVPHIMETMQDVTSSNKQRTSFRTLGVLAGSTGYVVDPYLDYPRLLVQAASVLPGSKRAPWALRQEVIRTFGILGAINPDRFTTSGSSGNKSGGLGSGYFINPEDNLLLERKKHRSLLLSATSVSRSFSNTRRIQNSTLSNDGRFIINDKADYINGVDDPADMNISAVDEKEDDDEPAHLFMYELYAMTARPISKISPARRLTPIDEEFYPTVALQALTSILKNSSLSVYHQISMQAIMFIFDSLGLRCVPFLKGIVPHILYTARTCGQITLREALLKQIARLSSIVKDSLRPYVPDIFEVIEQFWDSRHLATILNLIEKIAAGVPTAFREYVPETITHFLSTLDETQKSNADFDRLKLVLESIRNLRENLVEYIHILLPALLKLTDSLVNPSLYFGISSDKFQPLAIDSIKTVSSLLQTKATSSLKGQTEQMPALAAQPLIRLLGGSESSKEVGVALIQVLCICARKIGKARWLPLYHLAARNAILSWKRRFDIPCSSSDKDNTPCVKCTSLKIYDDVIQNFISTQGLFVEEDSLSDKDDPSKHPGSITDSLNHAIIQDALNPIAQPTANQSSKHKVSQSNLQRAWDVSQKTTRDDWVEWMRHFAIQLLREAPAPALRACAELAYAYQPLARELFSAAFACCWSELSDHYRADLVQSLKAAFNADPSPEILQTLLNLAEYAERDGIPGGLPIEIDVLAELALKCRSYAKALHYKEREHELGGGGHCIEDLITINRKLDLPEAALGVLKSAQLEQERSGSQPWDRLYHDPLNNEMRSEFSSRIFHRHRGEGLAYSVLSTSNDVAASGAWDGVEMQVSWLAKLGAWSDALSMYERKIEEDPSNIKDVLGCMNCLNARGEWKRVLELSDRSFDAFTANDLSHRDWRRAVKFCAQASWRLGQWDDLEKYSTSLLDSTFDQYSGAAPHADFDGSFFSAILNIHRKNWSTAAGFIDDARRSMDSRFTALMAESRKRAYPSMVTAQTLAEMEEIIAFRKLEERALISVDKHPTNKEDEKDARVRLISLWRKRLAGCRVDAEVHSSILAVRSLVLGPTDEVDATLTFSALSRQAQKYKLCEGVLLEPLKQLGADLNSSVFGFHLPDSLNIGLLKNAKGNVNLDSKVAIDSIVSEEASNFFPEYGHFHQEYCAKLISDAGSLERLCVQHKLYFAFVDHLWIMNHRNIAMERLTRLANVIDLVAHTGDAKMNELRVSCWLKLGEWKIASTHSHDFSLPHKTQCEVLMALKRATFENKNGYKAWHTWALINFRLAQQHDENRHNILRESGRKSIPKSRSSSKLSKTLLSHISAAVKGFVKAICLGTKRWSASVQQDLLHLLTCLFKYGQWTEVAKIINAETGAVAIEAWLGVLPQLLARIHMKSPAVRSVLHQLLIRLGKKHPQALMYPLSVLVKSPVVERKEAAESLMNSLKKHSYALVEDALMVSSELIRVAILWLELWHEGLEDASRLYFGEGNVSGMLDVLLPLHEVLGRGPTTRREQDFHKKFGRDLVEAYAYVNEYVRLIEIDGGKIPTHGGFLNGINEGINPAVTHARQKEEAENAMNAAWDLYYSVFRKINKQLPGLTTLELSSCSPALLQANNLELGVPGSYRVNGSFVKIDRFYPSVHVITSKQRPRKIVLRGGDGKDYVFLLKGHEDLRQDERVMQLFGLVNALLARDHRTNNHDLNIQRYCITPLSHNAGVVGWVPHCDTFHSLIRDYRASKRIPLNMENREMLKLAQDYELLTVMQKVEIFSEALERTNGKGNDIHDVLWTKSTNSEEWLDRRTKFTRSIAVMSMVGYILGLGDRHPSNLMLDQISGRVLHIDFGDCFEVAMHREKYPEKIPFRLTRMLIKAMEVSGIEGSYRDTCERTMTVLRDNRDSLVAMLDAFVYDPLISWRLLGQSPNNNENDNAQPYHLPVSDNDGHNELGLKESAVGDNARGRSILKSKNAPIREDTIEEDGADLDLGSTEHDPRILLKPLSDTSFIETRMSSQTGSMHSSQLRSLKMYSEIQSLASNLNMSSRIASITGDGSVRQFFAESASRSRLGKSVRQREAMSIAGDDVGAATEEALNEKALKVIRRVQDKLTGTDFHPPDDETNPLDVQDQVQRLIVQATSTENLCQLFIGWCAFW